MSKPVFVDLKIFTQADRAQSSQVPIPLPKDPYEAIRQAYLVWTNSESEPFEGEAETPESPHSIAPPTCHVEESEGFGTFGARSTSSDSIAPLSPDHTLTHTTPFFVPSLRMAMHVSPAMSPGLSGLSIGVESLGLGGAEAIPDGRQLAAPVVKTAMSEPLGLGYGALRR
nr:hypothetical protein [Tanacetum cinerariifolium]